MKKKVIFLCISILFSTLAFAQNTVKNIDFINEIADKDQTTFAEGVHFFVMIMGKVPGSFEKNIDILNKEGITEGIKLNKESPLRRGAFALMMAKHLDLKDSFLYMIFRSERYAFRACVANGIMSYEGSEWDTLTGGELIEIMTRVSELSGGNE